jgi:hypothetical protein
MVRRTQAAHAKYKGLQERKNADYTAASAKVPSVLGLRLLVDTGVLRAANQSSEGTARSDLRLGLGMRSSRREETRPCRHR